MPKYAFTDRTLEPAAYLAAWLLTWAGVTAALLTPLVMSWDGLTPEAALWIVAAVVAGRLAAAFLIDVPVVTSWKVRDGSRTLGDRREGRYRDG